MIKVIRNGQHWKLAPRRFTCVGCTSELEAAPSDSLRTESERDGTSFVFDCPVCHSHVWIDSRVFEAKR